MLAAPSIHRGAFALVVNVPACGTKTRAAMAAGAAVTLTATAGTPTTTATVAGVLMADWPASDLTDRDQEGDDERAGADVARWGG